MGKFIFIGAVIGSLIGWLMGFYVLLGFGLGAIVGGVSHVLYAQRRNVSTDGINEVERIELREEHLDIKKERVKTGEVNIRKEIVEGEKTITVPIKREEMVVEAGSDEELRIPLKEEEIKLIKYPVKVGEVVVSKQQMEEIKEVKEKVKKEKVNLEVNGNADVIEEEE